MQVLHGSPVGGKNDPPIVAITVELEGGERKTFRGRDAWALGELIGGGLIGCTPIERPAPRWSHYIHKLRRGGLIVETIDEPHGGAYSGQHARYVLRSSLKVIEILRSDDRRAAA
jgi:hypothetical protein